LPRDYFPHTINAPDTEQRAPRRGLWRAPTKGWMGIIMQQTRHGAKGWLNVAEWVEGGRAYRYCCNGVERKQKKDEQG
jgi:hypothetical protein